MKRFLKIISVIAGIMLALGIIFLLIGISMGGRLTREIKNYFNLETNFELTDYNYDFTDESITSIELNIFAGKVDVIEGNKFAVKAEDVSKSMFECTVEDGVLRITEESPKKNKALSALLSAKSEITIYIPKESNFDYITFELAGGSLEIEKCQTKETMIHVDAGKLEIGQLKSTEKTNITVSAGSIEIEDMDSYNTKVSVDAGEFDMCGNLTGETDISCDMGEINLELLQKESEYCFNTEVDMGRISLNNKQAFSDSIKNSSSEKTLINVTCNMGEIDIKTK